MADMHESKQTVNVYSDGWQCGLSAFSNVVADSFGVPFSGVQAALEDTLAPAPEAYTDRVKTVSKVVSNSTMPNLSLLGLVLSPNTLSCCIVALLGDQCVTARLDWMHVFL